MQRATEAIARPTPLVAAWARRYFTDPRARDAYLQRVERRARAGR